MRKILLLTLIFIFGFCGCEKRNKETIKNESDVDTLTLVSTNIVNNDTIENLQYDQKFMEGLADYNEPIKIIENYMMVGKDTIYFPSELKINSKTSFKGAKDNKDYILNVTRTNLTNLNYNFQLIKNGTVLNNKSGLAILGSYFFIASEIDEDETTGTGYSSVEYWDNTGGCDFSIRIGEEDEHGKLRAKVILHCENDLSKNIELEDNPTLRTE